MNLYDVLHRLAAREGPRDEAEGQDFHDAIAAHAEGLADSSDYRKLREARADAGLEAQFKDTSDAELTNLAADGDQAAQRERRRRAALASARPTAATETPGQRVQRLRAELAEAEATV